MSLELKIFLKIGWKTLSNALIGFSDTAVVSLHDILKLKTSEVWVINPTMEVVVLEFPTEVM